MSMNYSKITIGTTTDSTWAHPPKSCGKWEYRTGPKPDCTRFNFPMYRKPNWFTRLAMRYVFEFHWIDEKE